jgi:hypothetical protein
MNAAATLLGTLLTAALLAGTPGTAAETATMQMRTLKRVKPAIVRKPVTPVAVRQLRPLKLKPIGDAVKKATGPDAAAALDLVDIIEDEGLLEDIGSVVGWNPHRIIQDKTATHLFYYLPSALLLRCDAGKYALHVQYNAQEEGSNASVTLIAELEAPYRSGDMELLREILQAGIRPPASVKIKTKAIQPLNATARIDEIAAGLAIPPERIGVTLPATLREPLRLALSLTPDETEAVLALIATSGITGTVTIEVGGSGVAIPFRLHYGQFAGDVLPEAAEWEAGRALKQLTNASPFPLTLDSVNAYVLEKGQLKRISKALKEVAPLKPGKSRKFKLPSAAALFGGKPLIVWFGYRLETECESCLAEVDASVRAGIALNPLESLRFEAIPSIFESYGIYKLLLTVKTPYLTAKGDRVATKEIELTAEANRDESIRIYMPQKAKRPDPLLYKYRLSLVRSDGSEAGGTTWEEGRSLNLYIGSSQVEALLGTE